jgi:hypothetical protein
MRRYARLSCSVLLPITLAIALIDHNTSNVLENSTNDGSSSFDTTVNGVLTHVKTIQLGPGIVAVGAILLGAVIATSGYKLFRPVLFLCGFTVGSIFFYLIGEKIFKNQSYAELASWICFIAGGVIVGSTVLCLWRMGEFMVGAAAGIMLAFMLNTSVGYLLWPSNPSGMLYILIVVLGLVGGVLARMLERPFLIVSTSLFGAVVFIWGIGYFAGEYPNGDNLEAWRVQLTNGDYDYRISHAWWGYVAATIAVFILGLHIQFQKTALGVHHDHTSRSVHGNYEAA